MWTAQEIKDALEHLEEYDLKDLKLYYLDDEGEEQKVTGWSIEGDKFIIE